MNSVASHFRKSRLDRLALGLLGLLVLGALVTGIYPRRGTAPIHVVPEIQGRQDATRDMQNIKVALATFEIDNSRFPSTGEGLAALVTNPSNLKDWSQTLEKMPADPWGRAYVYRCPGTDGRDYDLYSAGPSGQDGNSDNIRS